MGFLLGPLSALGRWLLSFLLGWAVDKAKAMIVDYRAKQARKEVIQKAKEEIKQIDSEAATAPKEKIDELRKRKIALEESMFNDT